MQNMSEIRRPIRNIIEERNKTIERPVEIKKQNNFFRVFVRSLLILILLACIAGMVYIFIPRDFYTQQSEWQAVFLDDGQVYFAKVIKRDGGVLIIRDIYYLQNPGALQQGENNINKLSGELGLIKLGSEIHGPYDEMLTNWEHVLFIEDLKNDSKIVKAIKNYSGE